MISNIDDILTGSKTNTQPHAPEHVDSGEDLPMTMEEKEEKIENFQDPSSPTEDYSYEEAESTEESKELKPDVDEYGNDSKPDNDVIRDRLARQAESLNRKHQQELENMRMQLAANNAPAQVQQAAQDFEYNPDASGDWQQQLASFVKQTVNTMQSEQNQAVQRQKEVKIQQEFEAKFHDGMSKFGDFYEVVGKQPITDAMTIATRALKDPAAFLYAASKRNPQELTRIAALQDPYSQMVEMGRLEERMRKTSTATKAPRPLSRTNGDTAIEHKTAPKAPTIEQLIARADAKKLAQRKNMSRR